MDPALCRERMAKLMRDESRGLAQLGEFLEHEHGLLVAGDVANLRAAIDERQRCVGRISLIDDERRALCQALNLSLDAQGLEKLLRWCDPQRTLSSHWAECAVAAERCRVLNDRNGALVTTQLQHIRGRLNALLQSSRETLTYHRNGGYPTSSVGRVVTAEA